MKTIKSFIYSSFILCLSAFFCWGMDGPDDNDYPLTSLLKRPVSSFPHRVVFDVHHTLCTPGKDEKKYYPGGCSMVFRYQLYGDYSHTSKWFFYPGFGEVFLTLLEWGWHVDFFSAEEHHKTEVMIPAYLKTVLSPYSQNIERDYDILRQNKAFNIFSHHHLSYEKGRKHNHPYASPGDYVKDLTCIGDSQNILLVDDDYTYVAEDQYPFIPMNFSESYNFSRHYLGKNAQKKEVSDCSPFPLQNAAYVLGVLVDCKRILDDISQTSLRQALDSVLKNPEAVGKQCPWILFCHPQQHNWIIQGNELINIMRLRVHSNSLECMNQNVHVPASFFKSTVQNKSLF
ncbi:MAG: hypothetical protein K2X98_04535 [Alphaproteobacteria bacterium]|nr:hypothetical protein [Alphaproteobacteria bacterium]